MFLDLYCIFFLLCFFGGNSERNFVLDLLFKCILVINDLFLKNEDKILFIL